MIGGTQSFPDPDFPCAFRHRDQHDIHDPDAAYQETDASHNGQEKGDGSSSFLGRLDDFRQIPDRKVIVIPGLDLMPGPQQCYHIGLDLGYGIFAFTLDGDVPDIGKSHEPLHGGGQRNEHDVILVLSHGRLPLGSQDPDDRKGSLIDPHDLAHRIAVREQGVRYGLSDDTHPFPAVHIPLGIHPALFDGIIPDGQDVGGNALDLGSPVLVPGHQLIAVLDPWRHIFDTVHVLFDGFGVFIGQFGPAAAGDPLTIGRTTAAHDDQQVAAHTGDVLFDFFLHAQAQGHHGNHGANPDDDAQHGQEGPDLVGQHAFKGHLHTFSKQRPGLLPLSLLSAGHPASPGSAGSWPPVPVRG